MASKKCCIPHCGKQSDEIILHQFPHPEKDKERFLIWVNNVGSSISSLEPLYVFKNRRICHRHFEKKYLTWSKRLSSIAVPTLHISENQELANNGNENSDDDATSNIINNEKHQELASNGDQDSDDDATFIIINNKNCLSSSRLQRDKDLRFHQFPHSDERCKLWVEACKRPDLIGKSFESLKNTYICSLHFDKGMYGRKSLKKTAVPTLCLPAKISIQTQTDGQFKIFNDNITVKIEKESSDPEEPTPPIFSWQKEEALYPTDDTDVLLSKKVASEEIKVEADVSLYKEGPFVGKELNHSNLLGKHTGYRCNVCLKDIVGFRYTCVQCADWDLCGACEARAAHAAHYVLRVPSLRPYKEIQAVLAVIRQQLLSENLFFTEKNFEDSLKEELGDEAVPAAVPDPLHHRLTDSEDDFGNSSEHHSPKHKKRRLQASEPDEISNSQDDVQASSFSPISFTNNPRKIYLKPHKRAPAVHTRSTDNPRSDHKDINLVEITIDNIEVSDSTNKQKEATDETIDLIANRKVPKPVEIKPITLINPITGMEESAIEINLKDDSEASHLQVSPNTDDAALSQALHSKAYVRMQPLRVQVQQLIFTKK